MNQALPPAATTHPAVGKQKQQPWDHLKEDPNPFPSMEELEQSPTLTQDIQEILNRIYEADNHGVIIQKYQPQPAWLWKQWFGTVLYNAWPRALTNMIWSVLFCLLVRHQTHGDYKFWILEQKNVIPELVSIQLKIADKIWSTLQSLTTFLLTFFVGQSYTYWRSFYSVGRSIQGRLNDIQLLLSTHATRDSNGCVTAKAQSFLQDMAQQLQLFHLLHWAANAQRFRVLLTIEGWNRMVARGLLSEDEKNRLLFNRVPATQKHHAVLQSAMVRTLAASRDKNNSVVSSSSNLEKLVTAEFCKLRGVCGSVSDMADGRMPLAYAHFVQVLVDTFLVVTPIAKYSDLGIYSVLMVGILTLFYHGLLILAKVFLDPLDNEDYCEGCTYLDLAVLIRESNAASTKWINGVAKI